MIVLYDLALTAAVLYLLFLVDRLRRRQVLNREEIVALHARLDNRRPGD